MKTILLLLITCVMVFGIGTSSHALSVDTSVTSVDMVNALLGPGISLVPASVSGTSGGQADFARGLFSDGVASGLGIESGIIMTTGWAADADGPNMTGKDPDWGPEELGAGMSADPPPDSKHITRVCSSAFERISTMCCVP